MRIAIINSGIEPGPLTGSQIQETNLNKAIKSLRERIGSSQPSDIGYVNLIGRTQRSRLSQTAEKAKQWALANGFDAVIWNDQLVPNAQQDPNQNCRAQPVLQNRNNSPINNNVAPLRQQTDERIRNFVANSKIFQMVDPYKEEIRVFNWRNRTVHCFLGNNMDMVMMNYEPHPTGGFNPAFIQEIYRRINGGESEVKDCIVQYFSDTELRNSKPIFRNNDFYLPSSAQPLEGEYLYVLTEQNELLMTKHIESNENGRIHHSSLSHGKGVRAAGVMTFSNRNGIRTVEVNNESGHYRPDVMSINNIVSHVSRSGLNLHLKEDNTQTDWPNIRTAKFALNNC